VTEEWSHEPIGHVEVEPPQPPRYVTNNAFEKARKLLNPNMRVALQELIDNYRKRADERPVAITMRQLAGACQMSPMSASRAIAGLVERGFIVIVEGGGTFGVKRKPSRYRLTFFPCAGNEATHDYIEDPAEWRRQRGRKRPPTTLPLKARITVEVATSHLTEVADAVEEVINRLAA
jgi:hypothetical protein